MEGINFFDRTVMEFVQLHFHNIVTNSVFPVLTYLGEGGAVWILLALFFLLRRKSRKQGILMFCAIALGFVLGELLLKNIVCRERPFQTFPEYTSLLILPPSGFSFPSGHTCSSFAAAAMLLSRSKRWGIPAFLLACLIAFSRIFLFVHWPTDVLAGIALGVLSALFVLWIAPKIEEKRRKDEAELSQD